MENGSTSSCSVIMQSSNSHLSSVTITLPPQPKPDRRCSFFCSLSDDFQSQLLSDKGCRTCRNSLTLTDTNRAHLHLNLDHVFRCTSLILITDRCGLGLAPLLSCRISPSRQQLSLHCRTPSALPICCVFMMASASGRRGVPRRSFMWAGPHTLSSL